MKLNKEISLSIVSFAVLSLITGCSTTPISSAVPVTSKIESVRVSQVNSLDLGNKNGASVKAKFSFTNAKAPSFGIKTINDAFDNFNSLDIVMVRLSTGTNATTPLARFTAYDGTKKASLLISPSAFTGSGTKTKSLTFAGLSRDTDYTVSTRAYKFAQVAAGNTLAVSGTTLTVTNGGTLTTAAPVLGDLIKASVSDGSGGFDIKYYEVNTASSGSGPYTYTVSQVGSPIIGAGTSAATWLLTSALSSDGTSFGDGSDHTKTAGALNAGSEEYVSINAAGNIALINDAGALETWDVPMQLQKDTKASADSNVLIAPGEIDNSLESIS